MYKISIIIPVFNVEDTLDEAFNSILNQSFGFENIEVIFIDDFSSDNSPNIIKEYAESYENVKAICLDSNSGFAGRPRNIGVENASADYLMFLDPDDVFLEDACKLLYENITDNDLDLVSGNYIIYRDSKIVKNNWNSIGLKDDESLTVKSVDENPNLLKTVPSVWAKIIRRKFILDNNITFPVGVPAQDLVFVSHALLKADGIKFINKAVVKYIPREKGDNKSVTSQRTKRVLSGFIKSYSELYNILFDYNKDYAWLAPRNLFFWMKQFILSRLPMTEKIELLHASNFLFEKFIESDQLKPPKGLEEFVDFIDKKDFLSASKLSEDLLIYYASDEDLIEEVKNKKIFSLFYGMDMNIGGLAKAVFNRSNVINNHGYDLTLLNVDELKNFNYVIPYFKSIGYLNDSIDFINAYQYYCDKNTEADIDYSSDYLDSLPDFTVSDEYIIKKVENSDTSVSIDYYDKNLVDIPENELNESTSLNPKSLVKSEVFMQNHMNIIREYANGRLAHETFFTKDNFNYLSIQYVRYDRFLTLKDRKLGTEIKFNSVFEFHDYFVTEILIKNNDKAFLINECSGAAPNFDNIDPRLAYKIANIHTNPYEGEHCFGSPLRNVSALNHVKELDLLVVLTEGLKKDFIKEFGTDNIAVVPNFLDNYDDPLPKDPENINYDRISIFSRLSSEKNLSDAIKAFKIVVEKRPNSVLEICGRALKPYEINEERRLKTLVNELNMEKHVIFRGHVDNVEEEMAISLASMLVSHLEGMPMVILESMRIGTPVICYNFNYGPSDLIDDGKTGRIVDQYDVEGLAECILDVLNNPDKAIEMGKAAQHKVLNELNEENLFLRWQNIFKDVFYKSKVSSLHDVYYDDVFAHDDIESAEATSQIMDSNSDIRLNHEDLVEQMSNLNLENQLLRDRNEFLEKYISVLKEEPKGSNRLGFIRKFKL